MSFLASWHEVSKSYGSRPLFRRITLGINEGERVGLIGPNGSGKTTLLKLLVGEEKPDSGVVSTRRSLRVSYVGQEDRFSETSSIGDVLEAVLRIDGVDEHEREMRVSAALGKAGFSDAGQPAANLSGGWRKRLAIAREWVREPDLMLLDEPTNHLDIEGVVWLERLLKTARFACVAVSHDRYFLESVATRVVELNPAYPEGHLSVNGAYDEFLARRAEALQAQLSRQQALESQVRRDVAWLLQGAPARSTKENSRIRLAAGRQSELGAVRGRNTAGRAAGIDFEATGRKTRILLAAEGIEARPAGRPLFSGLDVLLSPGSRLGLIGPNGSGKTTLIRLLTGEREPAGGAIRRADRLQVVLFDQAREQLDPEATLRDALAPNGDAVIYRGQPMHVVAWAKRFLFREDQLAMTVGYLSGGEQARVLLARLMLQPADVLILDEPTNDLDIATLEVLEDSLLEFPGALVLVTHDRFMLDRVCTQVLALDGRGGAEYFAGYAQWPARQPAPLDSLPGSGPRAGSRKTADATPAGGLTTSERRELSRIEERIEVAEELVARLKANLDSPEAGSDHLRVQEDWQRLQEAEAAASGLYARWEELEARKGQV